MQNGAQAVFDAEVKTAARVGGEWSFRRPKVNFGPRSPSIVRVSLVIGWSRRFSAKLRSKFGRERGSLSCLTSLRIADSHDFAPCSDGAHQRSSGRQNSLRQRPCRPDVEEQEDRIHAGVDETSLKGLVAKAAELNSISGGTVNAIYAGLRGRPRRKNIVSRSTIERGYITLGGIRSTGRTAALGLGTARVSKAIRAMRVRA